MCLLALKKRKMQKPLTDNDMELYKKGKKGGGGGGFMHYKAKR